MNSNYKHFYSLQVNKAEYFPSNLMKNSMNIQTFVE